MATRPPVSRDKLKEFPDMTSWFNPGLLLRLLGKVLVSDTFGQYADRRLIVAALDKVAEPELLKRAQCLNLKPDHEGAVWFDFVADLGDGFDSTYAIASLLAREKLTINEKSLPRGQLLVMGGDEVYPVASKKAYRDQLRMPYDWAFPDLAPGSEGDESGIPVCAIPGNHDWYDGLVIFLALFAREEKLHLGSWRTCQRRSYFAFQLTKQWWLWGLDTQLDDDIDQPQKDYFKQIARNMPEGARIILCGPEPGWLYTKMTEEEPGVLTDPAKRTKSDAALEILDYAASFANAAKKNLTIPLVLSGDTHHYSRYYEPVTKTHFITSGGGGAFLHPTHSCEDNVEIRWLDQKVSLSLKTNPKPPHAANSTPACYPTREKSRALLWGDAAFAFKNFGFALVLGTIYIAFALFLNLRHHIDAKLITCGLLIAGMWMYFAYQEKQRTDVKVAAVIHGLLHFGAVWAVAALCSWINDAWLGLDGYFWLVALAVETVLGGAIIGGTIFGLYLMVTCRYFKMNHNDAFSAMRLNSYRNFLRLRIQGDDVTIYPIGLDRIPARDEWRINDKWKARDPSEPAYTPVTPLVPHVIEGPIVIQT
jgi:hypothetical protein